MATSDFPSDSEKTAGGKPALVPPADPDGGAVKPAPQAKPRGFEDAIKHLRILKNLNLRQIQNSAILDNFYVRSIETVEARLLLLAEMPLPIPRKPQHVIRNMQNLLELLAKLLLTPPEDDAASAAGIAPLALWRALHLLSRHLLISSLTAAPPGAGIWKQLHEAYQLAVRLGVTQIVPEGATRSLREEYYAAILLGCAQPTSFTGRDVYYLDTYLERFSQQVDTDIDTLEGSPVTFWINPENDGPATPYSRKHPRPETPVINFSCRRLATLLESQLTALEAGTPPRQLNLSSFASTAGGIGVMNRLIHLWGNPGKRRYPRRSQNYRGDLCLGFNNLCNLYKPDQQQPVATSAWMITNESPDGYAVMHLSGKTRRAITVGDVAALRTKIGDPWQLCIIRWALSENQEHLELGLQILAPRAYTANIALPAGKEAKTSFRPALVLPAAPTFRKNEALIVHSGALKGHSKNLVLVIERNNVEIREIGSIRCDERNGLIELYGIMPK